MDKLTKKIRQVAFSVMALCLAASCADDMGTASSAVNNGNAALKISFTAPDYAQVGTRSVMESGIDDVAILVFKEGKLNKMVTLESKTFGEAVTVEGIPSLPKATTDPSTGVFVEDGNENIICFLANVKAVTGSWPDLKTEEDGNAATYADFLNYKLTYTDKDALVNATYLPMYGTYTGGIVDGITNQISVSLTRALAKINFTVNTSNFTLEDGEKPAVVVNGVSLHNVPLEVTLPSKKNRPALPVGGVNGVWPEKQQAYPVYEDAKFVTLDAEDEAAMSGNVTASTFVAYMPENARGSYEAIASYKDKSNAGKLESVMGDAFKGLTYLVVDLTYTTKAGIMRQVEYTIYLGGNNAGDMNIRANAQYNVTTYIYGDNTEGGEVTNIKVTPLFDPSIVENGESEKLVDVAQAPANCYMVDADEVKTAGDAFYIPLSQVRKGWTHIEKSLADGQPYVEELDKVIRGGKWEIVTLWKTQNASNSNITGEKIGNEWTAAGGEDNMKNYFAKLNFQNGLKNGNNVVVALKAKDITGDELTTINEGDILWSWHIWLTNYKPAANGTAENGSVHKYEGAAFKSGKYAAIMDRNLGATCNGEIEDQPQTTAEAVKTYGFHYQWGRKDPFPASGTTANTAMVVYDADNQEYKFPNPEANDNGENYLLKAVKNPTTFYYKNGGGDWTKQDNTLWTGSASDVFSPAPAGWSLPGAASSYGAGQNAWAGFGNGDFNAATNVSDYNAEIAPFDWAAALSGQAGTAGRMYESTDGTVKAWYPAAGYRSSGSGALQSTGSSGNYWAGAVSGANGSNLSFNSSSVNPSSTGNRAYGFCVRCVHE